MKKLLIIGGGNMGYALASSITESKLYSKNQLIILETKKERINFLKNQNYKVLNKLDSALEKKYEVIILAVKPNDIKDVLQHLKIFNLSKTIIVSIAAGVTLKKISSLLLPKQPIVRVMPNTPCQIGKGMSAICYKNATKKQKSLIKKIFKSCGEIIELNEKYFDIVTAISGSGPAYFCYLLECLIKSGISFGLNKNTVSKLVMQTALGTMLLLSKEGLKPEELRKRVTSKKGTTEAAIKVFQKRNFENIINLAINAAKNRAKELSRT